MSDLAQFLLARVAEDEERALRAPAGPWRLTEITEGIGLRWYMVEGAPPPAGTSRPDQGADGDPTSVVDVEEESLGRYFERFDPARVLAECEAKRRIVELHSGTAEWCGWTQGGDGTHADMGDDCDTLIALAQPYADHEDFQEAWRL